eukprot:COSAG06_NODE_23346_length_695_cov_0.422819_2_plen_36_part_01
MTIPAEKFSRPPADKHAVLESCSTGKISGVVIQLGL